MADPTGLSANLVPEGNIRIEQEGSAMPEAQTQTLSVACPRHEGKRIYYHLAPCPFAGPHECSYEGCTETAEVAIYFHDGNPSFPCVCRKHANPETWEW